MKLQHQPRQRQRGFSMLETALVVLAMGVVLGVSMVAHNQTASKSTASEAAFMDSIDTAIFLYAQRNNRLPCPDSAAPATGFETLSGGRCAVAVGRVPYLTLGVALSSPVGTGMDQQFTYGVYRGGGDAATDLTLNAERSLAAGGAAPHVAPNASYMNLDDFKQAVLNAWAAAATSSEIHVTGNDADTGASNCTNRVANMAFIVAFKGSRNADVHAGSCFTGPGKPFSPTYDNLVRAVSFSELLGVLSR